MILSGLGVTFIISLAAAVLGTVLGFGLCMAHRSRYRALSQLTAAFIRLIQGVPLLVLLMVLFYVVFASARMDGIVVAIIAFAINFGVYVSEMIRTGIQAVDRGQVEAAAALGLGRSKTFLEDHRSPGGPAYPAPVQGRARLHGQAHLHRGLYRRRGPDQGRRPHPQPHLRGLLPPASATAAIYFLPWPGPSPASLWAGWRSHIDPKRRPRRPAQGRAEHRAPPGGAPTPERPRPARRGVRPPAGGGQSQDLPVIQVEHLKKELPQRHAPAGRERRQVRRGDVIAVIGPSGTGKTTLLRCLNRLEDAALQGKHHRCSASSSSGPSPKTDSCAIRRQHGHGVPVL